MKKVEQLKVKIFADGADRAGMLEMYEKSFVKGLTTNPTLMKKAGIAKRLILEVEDRQDIRFIVSKANGAFITVEYPYEANRRFKRDTKSFNRTKHLH